MVIAGSIRAARSAGIQQAMIPIAPIAATTPSNVTGSLGATPNRSRTAPDHRRFRAAIDAARTRFVPALVLAEVNYFLRNEREAMRAFMKDLAAGAFTYGSAFDLVVQPVAPDESHR